VTGCTVEHTSDWWLVIDKRQERAGVAEPQPQPPTQCP